MSSISKGVALRALTSVISVIQAKPESDQNWSKWKHHIKTFHAEVISNPLDKHSKRFLKSILKSHTDLEDCLPDKFAKHIWKKLFVENALEAEDNSDLLTLLFKCMDSDQMRDILAELTNSSVC